MKGDVFIKFFRMDDSADNFEACHLKPSLVAKVLRELQTQNCDLKSTKVDLIWFLIHKALSLLNLVLGGMLQSSNPPRRMTILKIFTTLKNVEANSRRRRILHQKTTYRKTNPILSALKHREMDVFSMGGTSKEFQLA